jgi:long-chain acyl-CoA synthetase
VTFLTEISGYPVTDQPTPQWIFDHIQEWARNSPDRIAFVLDQQDGVEEYKYTDVLERAAQIAAALTDMGVQRGDRVGILMENVPQWVFTLLGAMQAGAVTVPLATALPESSIRLILEHSGCKVLFADDDNWDKASQVAVASDCVLMRASGGKWPLPALGKREGNGKDGVPLRGKAATTLVEGSNTALLIYTSGTTGNPKGVELTVDNLSHEIRGVVESLSLTSDHRILSVLPFSHVLPLVANGLGPLCIGATVVFLSSISPQRIIDAFHRHRITFFICVPQFFYVLHKRIFSQAASQSFPVRILFRLMKAISHRMSNPVLRRRIFAKVHNAIGPDLRLLASGGSHFDPGIARDLNDLGYTVVQAYGLTETSAAATVTPMQDNRIGTVGKPIRGVTVRIGDPNGKGVGEVLIRGPIVMKGYYRADDETAEAVKDAWFHTGDLGFIDGDGHLSITGRSKDVIVLANGENVYPEELEQHYSKSPYIKEICILGISEDEDGEGGSLHAIVVPDLDEFRRRGQTGIAEMIRFDIENLSKQIPSYYRIHSLTIRNEPFPRTVTRKLKRFEIQQEERERQKAKEAAKHRADSEPTEDHPQFRGKVGSVIAELVRETKPDAGALEPSTNIELDLGFDSLARVELLGLAEARLGAHIDEHQASRIFTLGELIEAFEAASGSETTSGRSWKEIMDSAALEQVSLPQFGKRLLVDPISFTVIKAVGLLARIFLRMRCVGLEKLPRSTPFVLCPNHESFLDGPLLVSVLPREIVYKLIILGYSDYWKSAFSRRLAEICKIVPIDPNVNLVRAMQAGAVSLRQGRPLLIFPEGTRSIDGHVEEFKKGAAILGFELRVPIVPVGIRGTFETWPRGGGFRLHPVEFHFGDPIDPKAFATAADPYVEITERLRDRVKVLAGDASGKSTVVQ